MTVAAGSSRLSRHAVWTAGEGTAEVPSGWHDRSQGFRRRSLVDETVPAAVHTGFAVCELEPGGRIDAHVHSYEESFFVLDGEVVLDTAEGATLLRPGDYGVLTTGTPHGWRGFTTHAGRWAEMCAPQPRERFAGDTQFVAPLDVRPVTHAEPVDVRDPRTRAFGHIEPSNMDVGRQSQQMLAVSASMRTALLVYSGITVKMMVDSDLGAQLSTMFMVQYEPAGVAGRHDHPFEETYLILEGQVDAVFDGERHRLGAGDGAWAGVGCVHEFSNPGPGIVRWLETQAPQPPGRHSYRFARDWEYLRGARS